MRLPIVVILPILIINILVDVYLCRVVRSRVHRHGKTWYKICLWSSVALTVFFIALFFWPKGIGDNNALQGLMWMLYAYFSIYIPKYIFCTLDLIGRIPQLFGRKKSLPGSTAVASALALTSFVLMWWGALVNRFNIDVKEVEYVNAELPEAFDGLKIVQISDLHTGTFGNDTTFIAKLVDRINSLNADAVFFTGDIVNRRSDELIPFTAPLSRLKVTFGVYSILGNHDYGDYYSWPDSQAKAENMQLLINLQKQMGWKLLNNSTHMLYRGNDSLAIIGVENIGDPPFHVYGDLDAAYRGDLNDPVFKILLSHNPAHWVDDIKDSPDKNIALTLSGHTHAMQMELFGLSPAAMRYKTWGGQYDDENGHTLYVNIGAGEVGIPARIGATPEITLFTLRKSR